VYHVTFKISFPRKKKFDYCDKKFVLLFCELLCFRRNIKSMLAMFRSCFLISYLHTFIHVHLNMNKPYIVSEELNPVIWVLKYFFCLIFSSSRMEGWVMVSINLFCRSLGKNQNILVSKYEIGKSLSFKTSI
jgi:hypothetical protein